jgi:hypothetical protein
MLGDEHVHLGWLVSHEELLVPPASGIAVAAQMAGTAGRHLSRMVAAVAKLTIVGTTGLLGRYRHCRRPRLSIAADWDPNAREARLATPGRLWSQGPGRGSGRYLRPN